jgi:hypothetical protein
MLFRTPRFAALLLAFAVTSAAAQNAPTPEQPAPPSQPISQAETLLFMTNHLKGTKLPTRLEYAFRKDGTLDGTFDDSVAIDLKKGKGGETVATTRFLSGERTVSYPPVENAEGNPVILWFLDRDIKEMERLTGGKAPYFRKRIRLALVDKAEVRPVKFPVGGKEVSGTEIKVSPYLDDPNKAKFGKVSTSKYYVFTLSDEIPGGVYQIRSVVPDEAAAGKPLIDETLTFTKASARKG